jgi:transposase
MQPVLQAACESLFEALEAVYLKIKDLDKQLEQLCGEDEQVQLLMTVPGVGPVTALRFKHAIDDIDRFEDPKAIGAYFGLTPTQYSSGEVKRQGRISKCGSKRVRKSLVEAANVLLTCTKTWSKLKAWGIKIQRKKGFRKAVVAVARKLAMVLYRMLKTGEEFQYAGMPAKAA